MKTASILILLSSLSSGAYAHNDNNTNLEASSLKTEIKQLRRDIHRLEALLLDLSAQLDEPHRGAKPSKQWGCFLDDIISGGFYGTGHTEAEAKGKVLARCSSSNGACWEHNIKCSRADD